ncbi:MAG: DUF4147 domain-containing protein [Clostridia bacterium]|nr:DUF4147 domain-containing protein [Clostridia bacterium]
MNNDCRQIYEAAVEYASPYNRTLAAVKKASYDGDVFVVAVGKAAVNMANAAYDALGSQIVKGAVITKYGHLERPAPSGFLAFEAGHPYTDEAGIEATERVWEMTENLRPTDTVIFLLSGGASALFEKPKVDFDEYSRLVREKMLSGADISELNALRRGLSLVKAGGFLKHCAPAKVDTYALSDVVGNDPRWIGSGPTVPDEGDEAPNAGKYEIVGDNHVLCLGAADSAEDLGYRPVIVKENLTGEAKNMGVKLAKYALAHKELHGRVLIFGGETTVTVKGDGLGGRNQELVLAAARVLAGSTGVTVFSAGSDGTDGPTDAAGAMCDGQTAAKLEKAGFSIDAVLRDNNSYAALKAVGALVFTGATGTNVNDLILVAIE